MITYRELVDDYFRYFKMLEDKFIETLRFVELSSDNFKTYSIEFDNLIKSIGSELDVFLKVACDFNLDDRKNMSDYYREIISKYPNIKQQVVKINNKDLEILPFKNWKESEPSKSLEWWKAYNNLKHARVLNFKEANLENTLNLLGALYILEMYFLKTVYENTFEKEKILDVPDKYDSELMYLKKWITRNKLLANGFVIEYSDEELAEQNKE